MRFGAGGKLPDLANSCGVWVYGATGRHVGDDAGADGYAWIGGHEII